MRLHASRKSQLKGRANRRQAAILAQRGGETADDPPRQQERSGPSGMAGGNFIPRSTRSQEAEKNV